MSGVSQDARFQGPEVEEASAWLFALKMARLQNYSRLIMEGDSLALISKLKAKRTPNNFLGFLISDFHSICSSFEFISFNHVKRGCNLVAHAIAHLQPINFQDRIWDEGGPDIVHNLSYEGYVC